MKDKGYDKDNPITNFWDNDNHFWLDPAYHPTMNEAEIMIFFVNKRLVNDAEFDVNVNWKKQDNDEIAELLMKHKAIHIYDLFTKEQQIMRMKGSQSKEE